MTSPALRESVERVASPLGLGGLLLALVLGGAALWMTIHRHEGYAVECTRESLLYRPADAPRVAAMRFDRGGRLGLEIVNLAESRWTWMDAQGERRTIDARAPTITIAPGIDHNVLIGEATERRIDVYTQWAPGDAPPVVSLSPLPVGPPSPWSIADFVIPVEAHPPAQVAEARALVPPLALDDDVPTLERIERLATFLHARLEPYRGQPAPHMRRLNGLEQYREAIAGGSGIYCANHAEIYAFMAVAAGLPTRLIDVTGHVDGVDVGAHAFNETWDADSDRWIYVDLQLGIAAVLDPSGIPLGAAELLSRIRNATTSGLVLRTLRGGRIVEERYDARSTSIQTFLTPAATLVYLSSSPDRFAPMKRLERLLFDPRPALCEGGVPDRVAMRLSASWLCLIAGGAWLLFVGWPWIRPRADRKT